MRCAIVLSLLGLAVCGGGSRASALKTRRHKVPIAIVLLHRSIQTAATVHPISIRALTSDNLHGVDIYRAWQSTIRNDATHYVSKSGAFSGTGIDVGIAYVNGAARMLYSPIKREYRKPSHPGDSADDIVEALRSRVGSTIRGMSTRELRAHSRAVAASFGGLPAYDVIVDNPNQKDAAEPYHLDVIIGRTDSLPQRVTGRTPSGIRFAERFYYERPNGPYLASTFKFVPPAGSHKAHEGAIEDTVAVLRDSADIICTAHPLTIRAVITTKTKGRPTDSMTYTTIRNDATHWVTTVTTLVGNTHYDGSYYVRGNEQIDFLTEGKRYWKTTDAENATMDSAGGYIEDAVESVIAGLSSDGQGAHCHIVPFKYHGVPAYKVTMDTWGQDNPDQGFRLEAVIGRLDKLPRHLTTVAPDGSRTMVCIKYERPGAPYPASVFVFVPPPGAKNQDAEGCKTSAS